MFKLFDTVQATTGVNNSNSDRAAMKFYQMHCERIDSLKNLVNIPKPDEINFLWTLKSFNAFTFIPFCIKEFGRIDELTLSTYAINKRIADSLIRQFDKGGIGSVHIFISETSKFRSAGVIDHLQALMQTRPNISLQFGWNHSKVSCVKCGDNYFTFEGSGNWSENAMYEQYVLVNSKKIYDFRKNNILKLVE